MNPSPNSNQLAVIDPTGGTQKSLGVFSSSDSFELAQRMAKALAQSDLVPQQYKGNLANCMVALEVAHRVGASPMAVMQNLHVIHGRPGWSGQYVIAALNSCGRFSPVRFKYDGQADKRTCRVVTSDRQTGEVIDGPEVSIVMAKAEGWFQKSGSKWQTMPDQMLAYRAGSFFGRLYAPDVLLGMQTEDEIKDVTPGAESGAAASPDNSASLKGVNEKIRSKKGKPTGPPSKVIEHVPDVDGPLVEPEPPVISTSEAVADDAPPGDESEFF